MRLLRAAEARYLQETRGLTTGRESKSDPASALFRAYAGWQRSSPTEEAEVSSSNYGGRLDAVSRSSFAQVIDEVASMVGSHVSASATDTASLTRGMYLRGVLARPEDTGTEVILSFEGLEHALIAFNEETYLEGEARPGAVRAQFGSLILEVHQLAEATCRHLI